MKVWITEYLPTNIIRRTFSIDEDIKTLFNEERYDLNSNIVHFIDHRAFPKTEKSFEYTDQNLLAKQTEFTEGKNLSQLLIKYNDKAEICEQTLYIGDKLYEQITVQSNENGYSKITFQDGEEVEWLDRVIEGNSWSSKLFHKEELVETQTYFFDEKSKTGTTKTYDLEGDLTIRICEQRIGDQVVKQEFLDNDKRVIETKFKYFNNRIKMESVKEFINGKLVSSTEYEYDEQDNLSKIECFSSTGKLESFHHRWFDDKNRVVEEFGVVNGSFNGINGFNENSERFHFEHEYHDLS